MKQNTRRELNQKNKEEKNVPPLEELLSRNGKQQRVKLVFNLLLSVIKSIFDGVNL